MFYPGARCKTYIPTWQCMLCGPTLPMLAQELTLKIRHPKKSHMTFFRCFLSVIVCKHILIYKAMKYDVHGTWFYIQVL